MKIVACVNHVPDTASRINIGPDGKSYDTNGIAYVMNPYDEFALEEALRTKEKLGGEVIALTIGGENAKETLRKALAMGADSAILIKDESCKDSCAIAKILADEIKSLSAELVFMGKQSVDYDNSIVPQLVSEYLNYNCATVVVKFEINDKTIKVEREIEGGKEIMELSLPAIISAQKGLNEPRYPSMKGIMAAKKKTIEEKVPSSVESLTEVIAMKKPEIKKAGKIANSPEELAKLLREEAKVI